MTRYIKPNVVTVADNPIVQVKCDPENDKISIAEILDIVLKRFEFILGTSFDLQFIDLDGEQILAAQRYMVTSVVDKVVRDEINYYQSMTRTVSHRRCEPISDLLIFHESAENIGKTRPSDVKESDLEDMSAADLQSAMKGLRGKGFPVGTTHPDMVKAIREHMSAR